MSSASSLSLFLSLFIPLGRTRRGLRHRGDQEAGDGSERRRRRGRKRHVRSESIAFQRRESRIFFMKFRRVDSTKLLFSFFLDNSGTSLAFSPPFPALPALSLRSLSPRLDNARHRVTSERQGADACRQRWNRRRRLRLRSLDKREDRQRRTASSHRPAPRQVRCALSFASILISSSGSCRMLEFQLRKNAIKAQARLWNRDFLYRCRSIGQRLSSVLSFFNLTLFGPANKKQKTDPA